MTEIHLYIGDQEVDFTEKPEILYTYQINDLTNPTIVKNSFSKTITIKGTANNNHIFGHYWNVERVQATNGEIYFNASKKMDFKLFVGTEMYESGYVKLDEVRRISEDNYEYDISLFGGLGDYFYMLSIKENGEPKKLADLNFNTDIDFQINLQTVQEAWTALKEGTSGKWQTINFMTAYNGLPEDFDSDKMIIDMTRTPLQNYKMEDDKRYYPKNGWTLAELPEDMTEWQTRDLRSYLQRPCLRMKEIIMACKNPINNGGYEVNLSEEFFNENNPLYNDTWITLPMIQTLEFETGEKILKDAKLIGGTTTGNTEGYMYQDVSFDTGEFQNKVVENINITAIINPNVKYRNTSYIWFWNSNSNDYHTGYFCMGSLYVQLLAYNGDTVIGASEAFNLTTPIKHDGEWYWGHSGRYDGGHKFTPYMNKSIRDSLGYFESDGFHLFDEKNGTEIAYPNTFPFTITGLNQNITSLKFCYYWGASKDKLSKTNGAFTVFKDSKAVGWYEHDFDSWPYTTPEQINANITYSMNLNAVIGSMIGRTGTDVTKESLLNTEASPCEYLLSYCKMFGLYFTKNPYKKEINILTRNEFYNRSKLNDISNDIDRYNSVTIMPIAFDSKWIDFSQEQDETQYSKEYQTSKGTQYGAKVLNTGYEFNSDKKQLLKDNIIRTAIEGLEKSKYFTCYNNDSIVRPFFGYGMKYHLYNGNDTIELNGTNAQGSNLLGINEDSELKYYDAFPKIQLHDSDNSPTDGNNVLVFFSGMKNVTSGRPNPINYFLTDDSYYQSQLNEGKPCWLFVSEDKDIYEKPIARKVEEIPVFERYLTDNSGTTVKASLDFGTPQELFVPKYSIKDEVSLYHSYWKSYLNDLYDANTKVVSLNVRLGDKVGYEMMREFYFFENSIWRINKISDWNIGAKEDYTKVEFVKVQDMANYSAIPPKQKNVVKLESNLYNVRAAGQSVILTITTSNGGAWTLEGNDARLSFSKKKGTGNSEVTLTIPESANPDNPSFYRITVTDDEGNTASVSIAQGYEGETKFRVYPSSLIVPADNGTEHNITFEWINQGVNEITGYSIEGDIKAKVNIDGLHASISVSDSEMPNDVVSGKVIFTNGLYTGEVGIDQIPLSLSFNHGGGDYEFNYIYSTEVKYDYLPYWINVKGNKLTVLPNVYYSERDASIMVSNNDSYAFISIHQGSNQNRVEPDRINFGYEGGMQYVNVDIENPWTVEKEEWLSVNILSGTGKAIAAVTAALNGVNDRSGSLRFKDTVTVKYYNVTVSQEGAPPNIIADGDSLTFEWMGGTKETDIISNVAWYADSSVSWLKASPSSSSDEVTRLSVECEENEGSVYRFGKISIYDKRTGILMANVSIEQEGFKPSFSTSNSEMRFGYESGGTSVMIYSNISWKSIPSDTWLRTNISSGDSGSVTIMVYVDRNITDEGRIGSIKFTDMKGMTIGEIRVMQEPVEIDFRVQSTISVPTEGASGNIYVDSNIAWESETTADWFTLSPSSGDYGITSVRVTVDENRNITDRIGTAFFKNAYSGKNIGVLTVTQDKFIETIGAEPYMVVFGIDGGEQTITITSNTAWEIDLVEEYD